MEQQPGRKAGFSLSQLKGENLKDVIIQFIKFGIVGVSNTLISLAVYYVCVLALGWHYQVGNLLGFVIGTTNAYFWNSRYVFKMGAHRTFAEHAKSYAKTFVAYGGTFLLSTALLWLWVDRLGISDKIAPLINLCITIPLNFVINKFWTFKKNPRPAACQAAHGQDADVPDTAGR